VSIDKENNLFNTNFIYDITKFTHLDYPDHLSCIVWFGGCNMRCDYCYNKDIVFSKNGNYSFNDTLDFLKTRVGLLNGVVLSGGEATTHNLKEFTQEIKKLGFKIKLDTNGLNFKSIKELIDLNLLDFIALDYKAPKDKFLKITHSNRYDEFSKTLDFLIKSDIKFEVRTTVHSDLIDENDINIIINDLIQRKYKNNYYLQSFLKTTSNIGDLGTPVKKFDKAIIDDSYIKIVWR